MKSKLHLTLLFLLGLNAFSQVSLPVKIENNSLNEKRTVQEAQSLPYPIIFIHGLNSDSKVWDDMKIFMENTLKLTYGGRLDFCLNDNGSDEDTNKIVYSNTSVNADIHRYYNENLTVADFYTINFDVSWIGQPFTNSSNDVHSNESAIVKQGIALKMAIAEILAITGRDKVILFGHSMGGLASREYLQNPSNWQPDGNHHIAKLITTGTPHGGYEGTAIVSNPLDPIDWRSEAYRDLRHSYFVNDIEGVYLYGGVESHSVMNNNYLSNFYNVDVNCNGIINENIVGLNHKNLSSNVDYAYIIGDCIGCPTSFAGDGVVRDYNANFSKFYTLPTPKNEFIYSAIATIEIHSDLPKQIIQNMQGLDEPNELGIGYGIKYDKNYKGYIYTQPKNGNSLDYDDYKFSVTNSSQVNILINNIGHPDLKARIFNINGVQIGSEYIGNTTTPISIQKALPIGDYFLEVYAVAPITTGTIYPYTFKLSNSSLSTDDFYLSSDIKIFPNPTTSKVFFDNSIHNFENVSVINSLGQEISKSRFETFLSNQEVDFSSLPSGIYLLKLNNNENVKTVKVIKE